MEEKDERDLVKELKRKAIKKLRDKIVNDLVDAINKAGMTVT